MTLLINRKEWPLLLAMVIFCCVEILPSLILAAEPFRITVTVSIPPQKYFVDKIGGERIKVMVMAPPGAFPGTYEPRPRQMVALSHSRIFFAIGVPYEKAWLKRISAANKDMLIVHTDQGIEKRRMKGRHHNEPEKEKDSTQGRDPHIWLSPPLVKKQARTILESLVKIDPEGKKLYQEKYRIFALELDQLDEEIKEKFQGIKGGRFLVFHPSWGYFAQEYHLKQVPVEIEGKRPGPKDLKGLIDTARKERINAVFVQPQVSPKTAQMIARAINGRVAVIDPLEENWADNLRKIADIIKNALK